MTSGFFLRDEWNDQQHFSFGKRLLAVKHLMKIPDFEKFIVFLSIHKTRLCDTAYSHCRNGNV